MTIAGERFYITANARAGALGRVARTAVPAPVTVLRLADIDADGALGTALGARPGEAWLIRPDAHIAAVLPAPGPAAVAAAVRRTLALPPVPPAARPPADHPQETGHHAGSRALSD